MFYAIAATLLALVMAFVIAPLLRPVGYVDDGVLANALKTVRLTKAERMSFAARLLASQTTSSERLGTHRSAGILLAALIAAAVPAYLSLGEPTRPDQPLTDRTVSSDLASLVAQVEKRLEQTPDDARGWAAIAPVYARLGRYREAVDAYSRLIELDGPSPTALTARAAALEASGRDDAAALDREAARTLQRVAVRQSPDIARMVQGLAARLEADPNDLDGWVRLVRSYTVLGDAEQADAAFDEALGHFPAPTARTRLRAAMEGEPE